MAIQLTVMIASVCDFVRPRYVGQTVRKLGKVHFYYLRFHIEHNILHPDPDP